MAGLSRVAPKIWCLFAPFHAGFRRVAPENLGPCTLFLLDPGAERREILGHMCGLCQVLQPGFGRSLSKLNRVPKSRRASTDERAPAVAEPQCQSRSASLRPRFDAIVSGW
eukprot:scaffold15072_cov68-Phaeocystis_antarctica.AAC.10